jgi:hypothetical protein
MTAMGPAGLAIIAFVGVISSLAAAFSLEQAIRTAIGIPRGR